MERITVYFSGRVQGVGFRYATYHRARNFNVAGYVRNLPDGRVLLVAEGPPDHVARIVDDIKTQMKPYITDAVVEKGGATGEFSSFDIAY